MKPIELDLLSVKDYVEVKYVDNIKKVFDPVRKKMIILTPEEYVRQLIIHFLIERKECSKTRILVEKEIKLGSMNKRFDIVVLDQKQNPYLLVECKSHKKNLSQATFDQISRYNLKLKAPYLMISNGLENYIAFVDFESQKFIFLNNFPHL
jgi:hypothetical protein